MARYVWDSARMKFVDPKTREPMPIENENAICMPMIISDIEPYQSPIDGAYVGGRASRREDLKKHGCVPYEPTSKRPKGFGNPRFAAKHGLRLSEEAVHRERPKRIDPLKTLNKLDV